MAHLQQLPITIEEDEDEDDNIRAVFDQFNATTENISDSPNHSNVSTYRRRYTNNSKGSSKGDEFRRSNSEVKRRTAFMNNNLKRFMERAQAVNAEMENTIQEITFSKYQ